MLTDAELLRRYAENGSEAAFGELVTRHVRLVYSAAVRLVGGDEHLARDVAQSVFTDLARKAGQLSNGVEEKAENSANFCLAGWLYTGTRFASSKLVRAEQTRRQHEQEAHAMNELLHGGGPELDWSQLRPVLDDAMGRLADEDRNAVVLRFFEGMELRKVGNALGLSEDAARKRVSRALDKLRELLAARGVTTTAAALSVVLTTHAVQTIPAGLALTLTSACLTAVATTAATTSTSTFGLVQLMASTKIKLSLTVLAVAGITTPVVLQYRTANQLRAENESLHAQLAIAQTAPLPNQPTNNIDPDEVARLRGEHLELLRLRGEVTRLRVEAVRANQPNAPAQLKPAVRPQPADTIGGHELYTAGLMGKPHADLVKLMKQVGAGLTMAGRYGLPLELKSSKDPTEVAVGSATAAEMENNQFAILIPGSTNFMGLQKSTPGAIVARSKEAIATPDGNWVRVYTRADGSVLNLIHSSPDEALGFGDPENPSQSEAP